jgi:hypothetical protein
MSRYWSSFHERSRSSVEGLKTSTSSSGFSREGGFSSVNSGSPQSITMSG